MKTINWQDFETVELRAGTVVSIEDYPEAHKPAYIVTADFGPDIGILKSSARIAALYEKDDLVGKQIIGVVNFPVKQIGKIRSEFLVTGFYLNSDEVVLAIPERKVDNGAKLG